ncbi:protein of unknown function [Blastococcus saxobsidens DD2]|uniref:Uncharacterized protein n=1 Tax=Blastococcus saxobsidens (strain DD2) TaxID=1146883 RepID=H6RX52_BLASD|nr:protein of unknown function [Blastococcus saxobsidens DD2]
MTCWWTGPTLVAVGLESPFGPQPTGGGSLALGRRAPLVPLRRFRPAWNQAVGTGPAQGLR